MIKLEKTEVVGWEAAIRGMRNPMNSWEKSDSGFFNDEQGDWHTITDKSFHEDMRGDALLNLGDNDLDLMKRLAAGGPVHAKYRRMIAVYVDITAPLYWWKEFDTYKVGTVANSCSTMHKIADDAFGIDDFSCEHLLMDGTKWCDDPDIPHTSFGTNDYGTDPKELFEGIIDILNEARSLYLKTESKKYWWQMIQLLPSSYNQRRTVMLDYEVLANIYYSRKDHKLGEWLEFCKWIEELPYSEIITNNKGE